MLAQVELYRIGPELELGNDANAVRAQSACFPTRGAAFKDAAGYVCGANRPVSRGGAVFTCSNATLYEQLLRDFVLIFSVPGLMVFISLDDMCLSVEKH